MKLTGNTFAWKAELAREGFSWNKITKTWDREQSLPATEAECTLFAEKQLLRAIESGDLRIVGSAAVSMDRKPTNVREAMEFESGVKYDV